MERKKLTDVTEKVLKGLLINIFGNLGWGQTAVDAEEARSEASNVRSSHRSPRHHVGLPIVPGGNDVQAGSKDINRGAIIG